MVLNKVQDLADKRHYESAFIEAQEDASLVAVLVPHLKRVLFKLDRIEGVQEVVRRGMRVLKGFASAFKVQYGDIEVGIDFDSERGTADSGDLAADLPDLFLAVGEAAAARKTAIALIIDEIQYLSEKDLASLIAAVHRVNQKTLPILLVGAGLPQVLAKMGDAKSYAERLFEFPRVAALSEVDARAAIAQPAADAGVVFSDDALKEIFRETEGYPYFLQEWGYVAWNLCTSLSDRTRCHHCSKTGSNSALGSELLSHAPRAHDPNGKAIHARHGATRGRRSSVRRHRQGLWRSRNYGCSYSIGAHQQRHDL